MSYLVTRLVRASRLPSGLQHVPATKGVLLALADDCHDDGRDARPAIATLAREVGLCDRSIPGHLARLKATGLIREQVPPTQHHPRTWAINLAALGRLIDPSATLSDLDRQLVATLAVDVSPLSVAPDRQPVATLTRSRVATGDARPATEAAQGGNWVPTNGIKNGSTNGTRTPAPTPAFAFTEKAKEPNADNLAVIKKLAIDLRTDTGPLPFGEFVERVKQRCADLHIDYGRHEAVPDDVVHRACALAEILALKTTSAKPERQPHRWRARA